MNVLVAVKRVVDPYVNIRVKSDHSGVDIQNAKMVMNPFDEIALEEAIRLKEKGLVNNITLMSMGDERVGETLRYGLALGADRAIFVKHNDSSTLEPLTIAKVLAAIAVKEKPRLILLGKQSIDGDHNQTGQMLAGLLGWSQACFASKLVLNDDDAEVTREVDGGLETLRVRLPAVVTTDLRLNEPRYPSLPNIMQAKRKPFDETTLETWGVQPRVHITLKSVQSPQAKPPVKILKNVTELMGVLKQAGVLPKKGGEHE